MTTSFNWDDYEDVSDKSSKFDWDQYEDVEKKPSFIEESPTIQFGKSAVRGLGNAAATFLERSAKAQEEGSLMGLLGKPPNVSTERGIAKWIREHIPEESEQVIPAIVGKGIETAADPFSLLGGPRTAFAMGATGEGLKQAGAPKWLQIAGELGVGLFKPGSKKTFTDKSPEIARAQKLMKEAGLGEKEITLATNALKEKSSLEKLAKMYKSTEKQFENTKEGLEKGVQQIVSESFPGFEKGIQEVESRAIKLFDPVKKEAKNLVVSKPEKFTKKVDEIIDDVRNTLANSPDEISFINMLDTAKKNAVEGKTAEPFINFYQTLNRIGKWVDPSKKESYMKSAKDAIKDTFRDNGRGGIQLANDFEKANSGWVRLHQAEKLNNLLEKSYVNDRVDFNKLNKSLSSEKNFASVKDALGSQAAENFKLMSKIGEKLQKSEKAIEGGLLKQGLPFAKYGAVAQSMLSLNPQNMAIAGFGSGAVALSQYVATQFLTNPKYQNLWLKMADKVRNGSFSQATILAKEIEEMGKKDFDANQ